jgi:hypothetical protein
VRLRCYPPLPPLPVSTWSTTPRKPKSAVTIVPTSPRIACWLGDNDLPDLPGAVVTLLTSLASLLASSPKADSNFCCRVRCALAKPISPPDTTNMNVPTNVPRANSAVDSKVRLTPRFETSSDPITVAAAIAMPVKNATTARCQ